MTNIKFFADFTEFLFVMTNLLLFFDLSISSFSFSIKEGHRSVPLSI